MSEVFGPTQPQHVSFFRKWGALVVLSMALAIIIIDTTLLNVSLGIIIKDLNTTIQSLQWVITAYALTLSAFTITGGRFGDIFGRRRMFMLGAIIFALGSFTASISHNVGTLLIGESIVEGIGAALMMPATASLLLSNFHGRDRAIAFGFWGGVAGAASAVGPILGGWLTTNYSWRWGFRINVVVAFFLVLGALWLVKEAKDTAEKPTVDWIGVLLSSTGLFALVFGIIESSTYGWWKAKKPFEILGHTYTLGGYSITPIAIATGIVLLSGFLLWEQHVERKERTPLVSLRLFANQQFTSGMTTLAAVSLGLSGLIFVLPVFLQGVRGQNALHTGLSLLPLSISLFIASPLSVVLTKRYTPKRIIQVGLFMTVLANYVLYKSLGIGATAADFRVGLILFGAGMGFVQSQISNLTLSAVSVQQAGEASGVNNTARQIGSSLGSAVIGTVMLTKIVTGLNTGIATSQYLPPVAKPAIAQAASAQLSSLEFGGGLRLPGGAPKFLVTETRLIADVATTNAAKAAMLWSLGFALLSLATSVQLPNLDLKHVETGKPAASPH